MNKLVTVNEMRLIEEQANQGGLSYEQMMDKAGQGIAKYIISALPFENTTITGLVGTGNNGGDTLVALATLAKSGWKTKGCLVKPRIEGDPLVKWFVQCGGEIIINEQDEHHRKLEEWLKASSILLDGILGTGTKLPLKPEIASILHFVNAMKVLPLVLAVDCPSGIDCGTGEVASECIPAHTTICMAAIKTGLLKFPAFNYAGQIVVMEIGLPKKLDAFAQVKTDIPGESDVKRVLPLRMSDAHKGTFGTAMICAGSVNYLGAVYLCASAAYKCGVGLVQCAVPEPLHIALASKIPEATWLILPNEQGVISEEAEPIILGKLQKATALLLGPGWGIEKTTKKFLESLLAPVVITKKQKNIGFLPTDEVIKSEKPGRLPGLVIDADGLRLLAQLKNWQNLLPKETILTPHPGEMSALTELPVEKIQENRLDITRECAKKWGCVIVLKGALTVIAHEDGRACIIPIATAALAKAGSGDVLAGIITGLRAQGVPAFEAAWAGAWIHAKAGQMAATTIGSSASVMPDDVVSEIAKVYKNLKYY